MSHRLSTLRGSTLDDSAVNGGDGDSNGDDVIGSAGLLDALLRDMKVLMLWVWEEGGNGSGEHIMESPWRGGEEDVDMGEELDHCQVGERSGSGKEQRDKMIRTTTLLAVVGMGVAGGTSGLDDGGVIQVSASAEQWWMSLRAKSAEPPTASATPTVLSPDEIDILAYPDGGAKPTREWCWWASFWDANAPARGKAKCSGKVTQDHHLQRIPQSAESRSEWLDQLEIIAPGEMSIPSVTTDPSGFGRSM
ncbi:hypothetical protein P691DRAFT_781528 [Macrolepiota fuliginosa MF-IS2]|uniref:Uncharacterized protein n=1 Tax=Macrolepiota fuliginosa MF-IS2 TaxID=1400762 RepID=A0A9P5X0M3_9AGAR|nr:hypothetical protein P691DRAFT_781528 [Macrolepiota fuliginosa MF-IS2]